MFEFFMDKTYKCFKVWWLEFMRILDIGNVWVEKYFWMLECFKCFKFWNIWMLKSSICLNVRSYEIFEYVESLNV